MAHLVMIEGRTPGARLELRGDRVTIGRSRTSTLTVDDARASGAHAEIFISEGRHLLRDLGSSNGTYVNGAPLHGEHVLGLEDRIRLGSTTLVFHPDAVGPSAKESALLALRTSLSARPAPRASVAAAPGTPRPAHARVRRDTMETLSLPLAEVLEQGAAALAAEAAAKVAALVRAPAPGVQAALAGPAQPGPAPPAPALPESAQPADMLVPGSVRFTRADTIVVSAPGEATNVDGPLAPESTVGEDTTPDQVVPALGRCSTSGLEALKLLPWPVAASLTQLEDAIERRDNDRALGLVAELRFLLASLAKPLPAAGAAAPPSTSTAA